MIAVLFSLLACERQPSFVGPWEVVQVQRGEEVVEDAGFFDFDGRLSAVVLLRYSFSMQGGFEPIETPAPVVMGTNVEAVDIKTFYNERPEINTVELDELGVMDIEAYTSARAVLIGEIRWPGDGDEELESRLVLRR